MPRKKSPPDALWKADHPYHAAQGCYFVSHVLGHASAIGMATYDGNTCHSEFASWQDFKDNKIVPFDDDDLITRRLHGIDDAELARARERWEQHIGSRGFYNADPDYNLLYRWDWNEKLQLFYMQQRKALPASVSIAVNKSDEPEIRQWLWKHWVHMMRMWSPVSGWPIKDPRDPHQALEHASCALAEAAKTALALDQDED